jgi:hypothetical protein
MSVKQRIKTYIKHKNLSLRGFSLSIGMSENYISSMKTSIQPDVIHKIAVQYTDLNTGWLLTGEGSMLKNGTELNETSEKYDSKTRDRVDVLIDTIKGLNETINGLNKRLDEKQQMINYLKDRLSSFTGGQEDVSKYAG